MTQQSLGLMIALQGRITAKQYEAILQDQLLPIIQTLFHYDDPVFQDDNVFTHTATQIQKRPNRPQIAFTYCNISYIFSKKARKWYVGK